MSADNLNDLDRFLRGVRRRLMLLRVVERMGVAAAMSCAVALPLILLFGWHGTGALEPALLCIALGTLAGIAWGASESPTLLEAAMEADRQLQWDELLGSAWLVRSKPQDPWRQMVLADANRRCHGLSPASMFLRRLTPRAWSAIALSLTLTIAISAWIGSPAASLARDQQSSVAIGLIQNPAAGDRPLLAPVSLQGTRPSAAPPDGVDTASQSSTPAASDRGDDGAAISLHDNFSEKETASSDGQGRSLGRTNPKTPGKQTLRVGDASGTTPGIEGKLAGGNAPSVADATPGGKISGGTVTSTVKRIAGNLPWTMQTWSGAADAAQRAIAVGTVPPACRDLVRDYFQRD
jgi:hypothetical protein